MKVVKLVTSGLDGKRWDELGCCSAACSVAKFYGGDFVTLALTIRGTPLWYVTS